jgi:hypothetical protein
MAIYNARAFLPLNGTIFAVIAFPQSWPVAFGPALPKGGVIQGVFKTMPAAKKLVVAMARGDRKGEIRVGHFTPDGKSIETI